MNEIRTQDNFIGRMLCYIGWAAIGMGAVDFLLSIGPALELMEYSSELGSFSLSYAITLPIIGVVAGFVFFGFSEIIRQLSLTSGSMEKQVGGKAVSPKNLPEL